MSLYDVMTKKSWFLMSENPLVIKADYIKSQLMCSKTGVSQLIFPGE